MTKDLYSQIAARIIEGQEAIIGPVAVEQARRVSHLTLDWENQAVDIDGDGIRVIEQLVQVYKELFGQISVEVSKESAGSLLHQLSADQIPQVLQ